MAAGGGLKVQWLGHATYLITTPGGATILVDPWLEGNPKFPGTELPEKLDLVLLTHGHFDHTNSVVSLAKRLKPQVLAIYELAVLVGKQGVENTVGMNIGGAFQFADATITMVEARHSSSYEVDGRAEYAGDPAGFVLEFAEGPTLYLSGDTSVFSDMKLIAEIYKPEIAVLPIGDFYTMGPRQAAFAASFLQPKTILPVHWGTFPALPGTPAKLQQEIDARGLAVKVVDWTPGEIFG